MNFPTNVDSENEIKKVDKNSLKCSNCTQDTVATIFCKECNCNYCLKCDQLVHAFSVFKKHDRIQIKKKEQTKRKEYYCSHHPKNQIKLYCCDCKEMICLDCLVEAHQKHAILKPDKAHELYFKEENITELLKDIKNQKSNLINTKKNLDIQKTQLEEEKKGIFVKINDQINYLIKQIQTKSEEIKEEVSSTYDKTIQKITKQTNELNDILNIIQENQKNNKFKNDGNTNDDEEEDEKDEEEEDDDDDDPISRIHRILRLQNAKKATINNLNVIKNNQPIYKENLNLNFILNAISTIKIMQNQKIQKKKKKDDDENDSTDNLNKNENESQSLSIPKLLPLCESPQFRLHFYDPPLKKKNKNKGKSKNESYQRDLEIEKELNNKTPIKTYKDLFENHLILNEFILLFHSDYIEDIYFQIENESYKKTRNELYDTAKFHFKIFTKNMIKTELIKIKTSVKKMDKLSNKIAGTLGVINIKKSNELNLFRTFLTYNTLQTKFYQKELSFYPKKMCIEYTGNRITPILIRWLPLLACNINSNSSYFEIKIKKLSKNSAFGFGVVPSNHSLVGMPGWKNSLGYHSDDGKCFFGKGKVLDYGPVYGVNDIIGLYINKKECYAFFTKNGKKLPSVAKGYHLLKKNLYPAFGIVEGSVKLTLNFGTSNFAFTKFNKKK
ncbi:ran-binding protein 9/10 [Anaeramoeba flamelloides]|uniref:Ran-binding protein 9/10 n=1 Tax=Anaeramoeba flamelloides TaxID=1746091 RepID=A0ABQ8ZCF3_9EUKA|nr:ran-binding protein 9/10 [Anaeramoeba flamelloides]